MESKMGHEEGFCRWRCERGRTNARNVSFVIFMRRTLTNLGDTKFSWAKVVAGFQLRSRSYMWVETAVVFTGLHKPEAHMNSLEHLAPCS